jgi:O-antigen/teichoic acid export membrane protein
MMAEIFMGIYFNLSFWYKLTDQNWWGAIISAIGVAVMIGINVLFVPKVGYWACAWGGFAGYGISMLLSYFIGQKKYPVHYDLKGIGLAAVLAGGAYAAHAAIVRAGAGPVVSIALGTLLIAAYAGLVFLYLRRKPFNA